MFDEYKEREAFIPATPRLSRTQRIVAVVCGVSCLILLAVIVSAPFWSER